MNNTPANTPSLLEATKVWLKIGLLSFGGPAAQIALMHRMIVEAKGWLNEKQFLNALSFCMLLPGPEAMQLATYAGWRLHGTVGGLIAGLLFVIPGAIVILALAALYSLYGDLPFMSALFLGIKAAVLIVVLEALLRVSKKALKGTEHWVIAGLAFIGIFFLALPFPLIVLLAAAFGFIRGSKSDELHEEEINAKKSFSQTLLTIGLWLVIWWLPILLVGHFTDHPILVEISEFFSKLAVVTFGGAYAVLAYMGQDVVNQFGWLTAGEMMDGLGLAETTPGPLILVTEFVGYIAAYREGGTGLAIAAAALTLWTTFIPCFLWIFAGAPYIQWIGTQPRLKGALTAITAAVVGVILNLSIWFALHVIFEKVNPEKYGIVTLWQPELNTLDWRVVLLSVICGFLLLKKHWPITRVLLLSSIAGAGLVYSGI